MRLLCSILIYPKNYRIHYIIGLREYIITLAHQETKRQRANVSKRKKSPQTLSKIWSRHFSGKKRKDDLFTLCL